METSRKMNRKWTNFLDRFWSKPGPV